MKYVRTLGMNVIEFNTNLLIMMKQICHAYNFVILQISLCRMF